MIFPNNPRSNEVSHNATGRVAQTFGTQVTAGTATHSLSEDFAVLFTATQHDTFWASIIVHNTSASGTRTDQLTNIYVGASGEEQILIPTLLSGWSRQLSDQTFPSRVYQFPLFIPAGSRITAKNQALIPNDTVHMVVRLSGGGMAPNWCGRAVECLGASVAASTGTSITPGTASEGTFVSVGTTTAPYGYIFPMIQGTLADTTTLSSLMHVDIGNGDAVYRELENFPYNLKTNEASTPQFGGRGVFTLIPSGTAIQLRAVGNTAEPVDATVYGVY